MSYVTGGKTPQPVDPERDYTEPTEGPQTPSGVSSSRPVLAYGDIVRFYEAVVTNPPRWAGGP